MQHFRSTAIECSASTMYSRVRVLFDGNQTSTNNFGAAMSPVGGVKLEKSREAYLYPSTPKMKDRSPTSDTTEVIGDVELPFWVQKEGATWIDPDDEFILEAKRFLTLTDKRIFWEMSRVFRPFLIF